MWWPRQGPNEPPCPQDDVGRTGFCAQPRIDAAQMTPENGGELLCREKTGSRSREAALRKVQKSWVLRQCLGPPRRLGSSAHSCPWSVVAFFFARPGLTHSREALSSCRVEALFWVPDPPELKVSRFRQMVQGKGRCRGAMAWRLRFDLERANSASCRINVNPPKPGQPAVGASTRLWTCAAWRPCLGLMTMVVDLVCDILLSASSPVRLHSRSSPPTFDVLSR
ncbi:hypothetical protein B0J13DRAFT_85886 [Dactylonectria estremocensis]|uniref:Uncharacterized protein n=1 Tax=Dactylonectria estremocensis TaxID=1079267 RepID=A0A9P9EBL3_9HYPO|nr:hypothetical protein B0J13DRAFT_85886 [Dactylonectria estremocensis]